MRRRVYIDKPIKYRHPIENLTFWTDKPINIIELSGVLQEPIISNVDFELLHEEATALKIGSQGRTQFKHGEFHFNVYGGNGINVEMGKDWSNFHDCKFSGRMFKVNKAITIKTKDNQYIYNSHFDFHIQGANSFADIDKLGKLCSLKITGQELEHDGNNPFDVTIDKGEFDVYIDDCKRKGKLSGKNISLGRLMTSEGIKHLDGYGIDFSEAEILMNPLLVDTVTNQMIFGNKTVMNDLKIHSNKARLLMFDKTEYKEAKL